VGSPVLPVSSCGAVFGVKVAPVQLISGVDPTCFSIPKPFRWFASRVAAIELTVTFCFAVDDGRVGPSVVRI
jgi:hypothetical protein